MYGSVVNIFVGRTRGHLLRAALFFWPFLATGCGEATPESGGAPSEAAEPTDAAAAEALPPDALQVGSRYRFARATPVVRDLDPGDPAMAMAEPILLPESAVVLVLERIETAGTIWYRVQTETEEASAGWVSMQALQGRTISAAP
jgi:hypothetical protein